MTEFTEEMTHRYARHIIMPQVGWEGQEKLVEAKVLCVGTGGLGSPIALYLAAAGVGTIGMVDFDEVDLTNLQRQIVHFTDDVGKRKVESAADTLRLVNPNVNVVTYDTRIDSSNALDLVAGYDVVIDGSDNFPTRYLMNDATYLAGKPLVFGSIFQFEGQATTFDARRDDSPCYRCIFHKPPPPGSVPRCDQAGVFGVLAGTIGTIQASEAIKLILGLGEPLVGRLLLYDALDMRFTQVRVAKDPACPLCGVSPEIRELIDYEEFCGVSVE
jgi:adenylyltransferase/sulfurtransferase